MLGKTAFYNLNVCSKIATILSVFLFISACSDKQNSVRVKDLRPLPKVTEGRYIVKQGDSLYSIAWRYNWDFKKLAAINHIKAPYVIFPGQSIHFKSNTIQKPRLKTTLLRKEVLKKPKSTIKKQTVKKTTKSTSKRSKIVWQWPIYGGVIEPFSLVGQVNKGIDIRAKLGDAVRTAAAGQVVYAGNDLVWYGKLIIIKHNNSYLSAYAHNKELYVREGDSVKASQKIAEIGSTGTTEPKLHFEIRHNGKPVDPMGYLPKR
ncbi:MAG: peptidoglycan DD-metalloendopeptidase family protein [Endozoicomonas sp. (ex Botrylloides leachii)]|nr:peptidoglycan DD-metalloendopeptidase family protein [Endozoicomonas sp. (ex Botrylloides leachii)]